MWEPNNYPVNPDGSYTEWTTTNPPFNPDKTPFWLPGENIVFLASLEYQMI
jgi:hypothetical protein